MRATAGQETRQSATAGRLGAVSGDRDARRYASQPGEHIRLAPNLRLLDQTLRDDWKGGQPTPIPMTLYQTVPTPRTRARKKGLRHRSKRNLGRIVPASLQTGKRATPHNSQQGKEREQTQYATCQYLYAPVQTEPH